VTAPKLALQDADRKVPIQMEKKWKNNAKIKLQLKFLVLTNFALRRTNPNFSPCQITYK
jgi:hypothetical protein